MPPRVPVAAVAVFLYLVSSLSRYIHYRLGVVYCTLLPLRVLKEGDSRVWRRRTMIFMTIFPNASTSPPLLSRYSRFFVTLTNSTVYHIRAYTLMLIPPV